MARPRKEYKQSEARRTQVSISLPICVLKKLDKLADKENRNRSNFILNLITKTIEERLGE